MIKVISTAVFIFGMMISSAFADSTVIRYAYTSKEAVEEIAKVDLEQGSQASDNLAVEYSHKGEIIEFVFAIPLEGVVVERLDIGNNRKIDVIEITTEKFNTKFYAPMLVTEKEL
jgi:hypothetical protein